VSRFKALKLDVAPPFRRTRLALAKNDRTYVSDQAILARSPLLTAHLDAGVTGLPLRPSSGRLDPRRIPRA
jgi:hypothetical protein